jgi:hypothetical protein
MTPLEALMELRRIAESSNNIRFVQLGKLCRILFGKPRISGSHHIFKTPWEGDPRINIQNFKGMAKPYQVRQVTKAA